MAKKKMEEIVEEMALPIVDEHQIELVDIEFKKEGPEWYLRLFIDKPGGVDLDDCQLVSEKISELLDETDPVEQSYILEVSSPGIDRPLKKQSDYEKFKDYKIEIKLYAPLNGQKKFIGKLIALIDDNIHIEDENSERLEIPLNTTASVRLYVEI